MRPWMGAAAVAAAMLFAPQAAFAGPDDPSLLKFSVPSGDQYDDFEALGLDMGDGVEKRADGSVIVQAWVTDDQLAWVRAQGFENVGVVHDKFNIDRIRAEREQSIADERAAKLALTVNKAGKAGPSAAPGTVRAQRADYYGERGPLHLDRGERDRRAGHVHEPDRRHRLLLHRPAARGLLV